MKTITIKQPWVSLICEGIKDIENRTWSTKIRGRVLIHASQKAIEMKYGNEIFTIEQWNYITNKKSVLDKKCGCIIGSVEIVDCVINHPSIWAEKTNEFMLQAGKPIYNWVLANPILFDKPIPAKGKLSFWNFDI